MLYPTLEELPTARQNIDAFYGYDHNLRISEAAFFDMENLTSDYYPVMSPRRKRGVYAAPEKTTGIIAKDVLCYTDGADFVMGEARIPMDLNDSPKQLTSMGAYVIIMPDKKYINTSNVEDRGEIEETFEVSEGITFTLTKLTGEPYEVTHRQDTAPESPTAETLWIDTSSEPHALKQWNTATSEWVSIATTYIKISAPGIGEKFKLYDGVTISGLKDVENKDIAKIDGSFVLWGVENDSITIVGFLDKTETLNIDMTVARKMPNIDFLTESENRLWGCRYGEALNGEMVNEIYACKLGDFKNWNCFMGVSTDSYAVSVGTDGPFTGAVTHLGYPLFFKENSMHKLYGNYPANFQLQTTSLRGVQKGCERSLATVNEVLYYKSRSGVCAYDGSLPQEISRALGEETCTDAAAGAVGNKYYISMRGKDGYTMFVYDTRLGLWHKEDATQARAFAAHGGELYFIAEDGKILTALGSGEEYEQSIELMAETGIIGTDMPDKKYISRINVRMFLDIGARMDIFAEYDSVGGWQHVCSLKGHSLRTFSIPVRPKRCDHLRLKFVGEGDAKIYSVTKTIEQGSDY